MTTPAHTGAPGGVDVPVAAPARHLYVHLPFCAHRCGYCAFVVETGGLDRRDDYIAAVICEVEQRCAEIGVLDTIYLGGGTPTLMRPRRIARLLRALADRTARAAEVTVEANPETVDGAQLDALRAAGVTRVSLGAQSFRPRVLERLERRATAEQVEAAVRCARRAGFDSVGIDLLFAVPGQTAADLEGDIARALALGVDHVSWYELEIKPGTALERMGAAPPDEDDAADAYERIVDALTAAGFEWYETANFARPGHRARHNMAYWTAADHVGVGVGAVGTAGGLRRRNAPGVDRYVAALRAGREPAHAVEALDADTRRRERWMLGLRLADGVDTSRVGPPDHPVALDDLEDAGMLVRDGARVRLTHRARFVQNAVAGRLMDFAA
ncbi:MAG: radical SAM family heme chaperone HemW [Thermoleophilia bacterium]|nr:radical SAM family heme chaperone HemW [Thermoleophilia bacterium]